MYLSNEEIAVASFNFGISDVNHVLKLGRLVNEECFKKHERWLTNELMQDVWTQNAPRKPKCREYTILTWVLEKVYSADSARKTG